MGAVQFSRDSREFQMFGDYYTLCKQFWNMEDNDAYWTKLVDMCKSFVRKYGNDPFAIKLSMALINTKEEQYKVWQAQKRNEENYHQVEIDEMELEMEQI